MKISEITTEKLKSYLRLDDDSFNTELSMYRESAINYIKNHTGIKDSELDLYEDLTMAVFVLVSDFFENHLYTQSGVGTDVKVNPIIDNILDHHRGNLV